MHVETQIRHLLGITKSRRDPSILDPWSPIWDWSHLGYDGLFSAFFFLTLNGQKRWRAERTILFPSRCCICDQPPTRFVDFVPYARVPYIRVRRHSPVAIGIPHCVDHARLDPYLIIERFDEHEPFAAILILGTRREFLASCLELNCSDGDYPPPWIVFPKASPASGWNQGTNEAWMMRAWAPFWSQMGQPRRGEYLSRWHAPSEWEERLRSWRLDVTESVGA